MISLTQCIDFTDGHMHTGNDEAQQSSVIVTFLEFEDGVSEDD